MKIILLVLLLIPVFAFHVFVFVDTVSSIKVPANRTSTNMDAIPSGSEKVLRKANLKVVR